MSNKNTNIVSAAELGQYVFCPEASRLKIQGAVPSLQAKENMAQGDITHSNWQVAEDRRSPSRLRPLLIAVAALLLILALLWYVL